MTRTPDRTFQAAARAVLLEEMENAGAAARPASAGTGPSARSMVRGGLAVVIVGATVAVAWVGILAAQHRHPALAPPAATSRTSASTARPSPTRGVDVTDDRMRTLIDQVRGTGRLTGPITGAFTITSEYGSPVLHLTDLDVGSSRARTVLVAVDHASATCAASSVGTVAGMISAKATQTVDLQDSSPQTLSDLSDMKALAIWPQDMGCVAAEVSAGTIDWTLPGAIRSLAASDLGRRAAAHGHVVVRAGRPVQYSVAPDDRIDAVAARFGVTVNELLYLNPLRDRGNDQQLYVGETLNLDPLDRAFFSRSGF